MYEIVEDNVIVYADGKMSLRCAENKTLSPKYKTTRLIDQKKKSKRAKMDQVERYRTK